MNTQPTTPEMAWWDDALHPIDQVGVDVRDRGYTVGFGVFETCKVIDGAVFALTRHLRRLRSGCASVGLDCPSEDAVREAVAAVLNVRSHQSALGRLRITVSAGVTGDLTRARPSLLVTNTALAPWPDAAVVISPWPRNERSAIAGVKTTSYLENLVIANWANAQGAHEAIIPTTAGTVCEGTASNVVVAMGEQLITPPLSTGCLPGISRELLLEWAREAGLPMIEADLAIGALDDSASILLTSSTRDVQPVRRLHDRELGVSDLAAAAIQLFSDRMAKGMDP